MLSRWEETVDTERDQHNRYPATASLAYKQGFLDRPIVDQYATDICKPGLQHLVPDWKPEPKRFSVKLSHDIDCVQRASTIYHTGRAVAADLLKRRNARSLWELPSAYLNPDRDPFTQGIYELAELSEQYGFQSAFYFKGAVKGPYDQNYDPSSDHVRKCIENLLERGHEVGFHPGYRTYDNPERFKWEKDRLMKSLNGEKIGGRQHYLRFQVPDTWHIWEQHGMAYDSTLGYADHEGFRCGTCHPL
ncbi:MAG: DUF7033 domain-containing protein [bacterium]